MAVRISLAPISTTWVEHVRNNALNFKFSMSTNSIMCQYMRILGFEPRKVRWKLTILPLNYILRMPERLNGFILKINKIFSIFESSNLSLSKCLIWTSDNHIVSMIFYHWINLNLWTKSWFEQESTVPQTVILPLNY